jgi:hypothetical protein
MAVALDGKSLSRLAPWALTTISGATVAGISSIRAAVASANGAPIRPVADPASTFEQRAHSAFWRRAGGGSNCTNPQSGHAIRSSNERGVGRFKERPLAIQGSSWRV